MRLIDADALEQIITEKFKEHYGNTVYQFIRDFFTFVIRQIRKAPTIEAEPVKHGRWNKTKIISASYYGLLNGWECSNCEYSFEDRNKVPKYPKFMKYCPNCGAKMDGKDNNND